VKDILVINVDQGSTGVQGEVMVVVEAPLGQLSELLQRGMRILDDL
jgi:hypothetical protein